MKLCSPLFRRPWFTPVCALAGAAVLLILFMAFGAQRLALGAAASRMAAGVLLALPVFLAAALLWKEGCSGWTLYLPLASAAALFLLRLACLDCQTPDYRDFLSVWTAFFRDHGGFAALKYSLGDYNVPYLYLLAAISYIPMPDLYLIKWISCLFDVLLAWGGFRLTRQLCRSGSRAPLACFLLLLLLPTAVLNGAYWGQCDSLYASLILLALAAALEDRPGASVLLLALAFSFKLQTVFLIPLWCVFWYTGRVKFRHLLLFPAGYFATILPAVLLGRPLVDILKIYLNQTGTYSALTMNAPSVYAFLPYQAEVDVGLLSRLGIAAAFLLVFALLGSLFLLRRRVTPSILFAAAVVLAIGVPFLLPHMHDRYFFPADVLTVVWACASWRRFPTALLVQLSSLSSYNPYLNLRYTCPVLLGGRYYVMGLEALLMLTALIGSLVILIRQLRTSGRNFDFM